MSTTKKEKTIEAPKQMTNDDILRFNKKRRENLAKAVKQDG